MPLVGTRSSGTCVGGREVRYEDSVEKSAEYLRLAIAKMSVQAAALHPVSYAVWYDYVSGRNASLIAEVNSLVTRDGRLDEATTIAMYCKHVADIDPAVAERVGSGLQKVMSDISDSAAEASLKADRFGDVLEKWSGETTAASTAQADVAALIEHTRQMQGAIGTLKLRLNESHREIAQLRQEVNSARQEALADGLTGLCNRRAFDQAFARVLSTVNDGSTTLLIADIDHFKRVNDTYGHVFGDKVICAVADILKQNTKGKDTAARFGGEEFAILLPDTPIAGGRQLAETIRSNVERLRIRRVDKHEPVSNITVSLGVAAAHEGETPVELIARADKALYASKSNGRNRVTVAS